MSVYTRSLLQPACGRTRLNDCQKDNFDAFGKLFEWMNKRTNEFSSLVTGLSLLTQL